MSPDRYDEDCVPSGSTLSFPIVQFHLFRHVSHKLAMIHGQNGLNAGQTLVHDSMLLREWLYCEPHGHILLVRHAGDGVPGSTMPGWGVPRVVVWDPVYIVSWTQYIEPGRH